MEENERAYWTHEVASTLGIGESTLRKWCIELENNGYIFSKGEQDSRAFLEKDMLILIRMKEEIRLKKKTLKDAAKLVVQEARTPLVLDEINPKITEQLPVQLEQQIPMFTLEDVRKIVKEELQEQEKERVIERDKKAMELIRELQEVKRILATTQEKKPWWRFW
ncbi:DUF3967 domain-containing protein [Bacillus sp. CDB3]|uniref:DUF3967 domain-containing protein n=1 Tax=Bacillus sp. CDB3 TaxID=360310 RepID=UPI0009D8204A|nr:DUF3967 domain-containing protein [Bacillus sp. CDB3]OQR53430.1 hypothetical protein CDB3_29870 [Bacillus sp. CDB3]